MVFRADIFFDYDAYHFCSHPTCCLFLSSTPLNVVLVFDTFRCYSRSDVFPADNFILGEPEVITSSSTDATNDNRESREHAIFHIHFRQNEEALADVRTWELETNRPIGSLGGLEDNSLESVFGKFAPYFDGIETGPFLVFTGPERTSAKRTCERVKESMRRKQ